MSLFEGYPDAYGTYILSDVNGVVGEKNVGQAKTVKNPITDKLWEFHLRGMIGLGVIPINAESKVKFGAIDIDSYDGFDHQALIAKIEKLKMPLVVCRSKSGGAHCYIFMSEWTSAKIVQTRLREMAGLLGYGTSEIFPKQTQILVERGDLGQWINMPYFDAEKSTRFAYSNEGRMLAILEFIAFANSRRITSDQLNTWGAKSSEPLPGGPPCLQVLCAQGFPSGTRNNGLFNIGVYCMKVSPDGWEKMLVDYNLKFMDPPLEPVEVMGVIKSMKKKDYNYSCQQAPIQAHCNANKCRACKFGVGQSQGLPVLGTLTKLNTTPAVWFLDIEGDKRVELTTDQLQDPRKFQLMCMEYLNTMPSVPKRDVWNELIGKLMENLTIIEVSNDMSPQGQLLEHVDRFCTGRVVAKTADEILLGKPWTNNGRHYFRVSDLIQFLERQRFKYDGMRWLCKTLKNNGGEHKFLNIKGKGVNLWSIPEFIQVDEKLTQPNQELAEPFQ
jgi:hypothetical protein